MHSFNWQQIMHSYRLSSLRDAYTFVRSASQYLALTYGAQYIDANKILFKAGNSIITEIETLVKSK
jgi:hypothetical protein